MALENVKQEIIGQAEVDVTKIISEAEQKAKEIHNKAKKEVENYKKSAKEKTTEFSEKTERKILAGANFDAQRMILSSKNNAISQAFLKAETELSKLSSTEKKKFLKNLTKKAKDEITVKTIYVNSKDTKLISEKVTVKFIEISGGLIGENKDKTISVNFSVEEILEDLRKEMIVKISEVLIGNE